MLRRIQRMVFIAFTCALGSLFAVGIASVLTTQRFLSDADWNDHTHDVLWSLDELRVSLLEARGAARALLIEPAHNDLNAFVEWQNRAHRQIEKLRQLISDNPEQMARLEELAALADRRLTQLADGLDEWNKNHQDHARSLIAGTEGQSASNQLLAKFDQITQAEQALLQQRHLAEHHTALAVELITGACAALAVTLVTLAYWRIRDGLHERSKALADLAAARGEAEAANRFKSDFLANMSHEIRTPVAAIIGYGDILLDPSMNASERLECINTVRRNGMHLLTLINDILDLSKVESGRLHVEQIDCNPCILISDVASMMRVRAAEKNLSLEIKVDGVIPEKIRSDPMRLRQILINLFSNAIKFTDRGWVRLIVRLATPADDPNPRLRFDVTDTGVGMSPAEIAHIFQPFVQGDASTTRRYGGTGLGLAISRRLAEFLGGTLTVDSTPGRGSTFTLEIQTGPLTDVRLISRCTESTYDADSGEYRAVEEIPAGSRGRVLVAEDGQDNRNLVAYVLRRGGYHVEFAENGRLAVQAVSDAQRLGRPFELVVMDMQMPELDGYAATAKLRGMGFSMPVIALTANAMKTDRDKCLAAGCTDYLSKPVDRRLLLQCVQRHMPRVGTPARTTPDPAAPALVAAGAPASPAIAQGQVQPAAGPHAGETDGMEQLRRDFVANLPNYISELNAACARHDAAAAQRVLHQLSGVGGVFGFNWISEDATVLDRRLRTAEPLEQVMPTIEDLANRIRQIDGYKSAGET